jgi:hypothetical protein
MVIEYNNLKLGKDHQCKGFPPILEGYPVVIKFSEASCPAIKFALSLNVRPVMYVKLQRMNLQKEKKILFL